jgi:O-antigen/teichoic acid export membrane protein
MGIAKTIARNTSFESITNLSELGIAFVIGIALTRGLGTEQYGLYAYTIWLLGLAQVGTNLGLGDMSRRFIPEAIGRQSDREPAGFVQLALMFRTTAAMIVLIAIIISSGYWARMSGNSDNQLLFMVAAITMLPSTIQQALIAIFKGFQKFEYSLYVSLITSPLRLILVVIFMALGFGVMTVIIISIVTVTVGAIFGFFLLRRLVPLRSLFSSSLLSSERKKQALRYSLIIAGMMVLGYLLSQETEIFFIGLYR